MAELHILLKQLLDSTEEKANAYKEFQNALKEYEERCKKLSEQEYITLEEYEDLNNMYQNKEICEKSYHIQQELFASTRQEIINCLLPVNNMKLKFEYSNDKEKNMPYCVWINYNVQHPEHSSLLLQNLQEENSKPVTIK